MKIFKIILSLIICAFFLQFSLLKKTEQNVYLNRADIAPTMNELFALHIDKHKMTPELMKRTFQNYLELFDPMHIYLLEKDANKLLQPSDETINIALQDYNQQNYAIFERFNEMFQEAIKAQRVYRAEIEKKDVFKKAKRPYSGIEQYETFAKTEEELKKRVEEDIVNFITQRHVVYNVPINTKKEKKALIGEYEKLVCSFENTFLFENQKGKPLSNKEKENLFVVQVLKALSELDSHTVIFTRMEALQLKTDLEQSLEGIGVILTNSPSKGVIISGLSKGAPAERSGLIKINDIIIGVDDVSMANKHYEDVLKAMTGTKGSLIKLTLKRSERKNKEQIVTVTLQREKIELTENRLKTKTEPFGDGIIAKFTLDSFYEGDKYNAADDLKKELIKYDSKLKGCVLDLRNNGGGFLDQAIKLTGLFIKNGVVAIAKYSDGYTKYFRDLDNLTYFDGPMVVLISRASASAAEITAQTLKDYGAAIIVGDEKTYGKGSIQYQNVTDSNSRIFFKVTAGKYYTPSGQSTQIKGVPSDIVIPTALNDEKIGEEFLEFPIKADKIESSFNDPLIDIKPFMRQWYKRHYLPFLEKKDDTWQAMLPQLRTNSAVRLSNNNNFQLFLKDQVEEQKNRKTPDYKPQNNYGENDLQMQEALNVLKDMILINKTKKQHEKII